MEKQLERYEFECRSYIFFWYFCLFTLMIVVFVDGNVYLNRSGGVELRHFCFLYGSSPSLLHRSRKNSIRSSQLASKWKPCLFLLQLYFVLCLNLGISDPIPIAKCWLIFIANFVCNIEDTLSISRDNGWEIEAIIWLWCITSKFN